MVIFDEHFSVKKKQQKLSILYMNEIKYTKNTR